VQKEILESNQSPKLRVYALWVPFSGGTRDAAVLSQQVLPDPRVVHYWDESALSSSWFADNVDHSLAPAWDVYYLYGPDARWASAPGPLVSSGGTVIGKGSALRHDTIRLLADSGTS
jgi:hypothetical protein